MPRSLKELLPIIYDELRAIAASKMRSERADHTLQTTALVNEVYLKLRDQTRAEIQDESHLKAIAAEAMYRVLVDHARGKERLKRGGMGGSTSARDKNDDSVAPADRRRREVLDGLLIEVQQRAHVDLLTLHDALKKLAVNEPRWERVVVLRIFSGLTAAQAAAALGISERTVDSDWKGALAWLKQALVSP